MSWTLDAEHALGTSLRIRRFTWPNGLRLLLLCDHAAPIFSFQTWFRVGSRHERPGATGMAHFFEHLMFGETANQPLGAFDRMIEEVGGDNNAATWNDWTFYSTSLPAAELELAMRLESDRMCNLTLSDDQLATEREVVMSERKERVEDDVDGFLDEKLSELAYRVHPYRWPTIGWMDDIRSLGKDQVNRFYRTYYAPNNATIVLVGAVEENRALELVDRYYGAIPASELAAAEVVTEPPQDAERRAEHQLPVAAERLLVGYKVPGQGHPDWAAIDFVGALLCGSPSARLYRQLVVETQMATSLDAGVPPFRDPALFRVTVNMARGHRAEDGIAALDHQLAELATTPVPERELLKIKNGLETDFWTDMEDCDGKAETLGHYETTLGDFRQLFHLADRFSQVTADDIQRVVTTYLQPSLRSIVIGRPLDSEESSELAS